MNRRESGFSNADEIVSIPLDVETVEIKARSIFEHAGSMPEHAQAAYDAALERNSAKDSHLALLILDRWRFINLSREKQLEEYDVLQECYQEALKDGIRANIHPDDLVDLVHSGDNIDPERLGTFPVLPPDGIKSF